MFGLEIQFTTSIYEGICFLKDNLKPVNKFSILSSYSSFKSPRLISM